MADIHFISLVHLIQHPDKYHGKKVRVIGVATFKFEAKALYFYRDDQDHAVTKNAVWLSVELTEERLKLHQKYVLVEGVFDQENLGHLKLYSGAITEIDRLDEWKEA